MAHADASLTPAIVEAPNVPVFYVDGIVQIDHIGRGQLQFTFYRNTVPTGGASTEREVNIRLVLHAEEFATMRRQADAAMAGEQLVFVGGSSAMM